MAILSFDFLCDLDLQPTQTNVSNGTTTPQGEHLCKIILKSMHKCKSYGPEKSGQVDAYLHACTYTLNITALLQAGLTINSRIPVNFESILASD